MKSTTPPEINQTLLDARRVAHLRPKAELLGRNWQLVIVNRSRMALRKALKAGGWPVVSLFLRMAQHLDTTPPPGFA